LFFAQAGLEHDLPIFMLPVIAGMIGMQLHVELLVEMEPHKLLDQASLKPQYSQSQPPK
jgi:hypothetical protein